MDNVVLGLTGSIIVAATGVVTALINKGFLTPSKVDYDTDAIIDSHIDALGHKYGCQRISVIGYHNGGHWRDGSSIKKFSVRHEYYNAGQTQPTITTLQNMSTGMLKELPSLIWHQNLLFEADIDKTEPKLLVRPSYFKVMREYGTIATTAVAIKKNIFNWKTFRYEKQMVASIHFNWGEQSGGWNKSFLNSNKYSIPFSNDIKLLMLLFEPKHIKFDVTEVLQMQIDKCKELL